MDTDLAPKAIAAALHGNWKEAIAVNKQILQSFPQDIDALNRLGRAQAEIGNLAKARECSQKVLKIDPINSIAVKALAKWKGMKPGVVKTQVNGPSLAEAFLEESGKTKIVSLMHLGCPTTLSDLDSGDVVKLDYHCHRIAVISNQGKYIGRLPDDLSAKLRKLISLKNKYQVLIKSIESPNEVKIFIRGTLI